MIQTDQAAPISQGKDVKTNADGSVDVYFGPTAPAGMAGNWGQTLPFEPWLRYFSAIALKSFIPSANVSFPVK